MVSFFTRFGLFLTLFSTHPLRLFRLIISSRPQALGLVFWHQRHDYQLSRVTMPPVSRVFMQQPWLEVAYQF
jgi:hypothetical protein